jgi:predicted NBD/HSP70 family sugar kinase
VLDPPLVVIGGEVGQAGGQLLGTAVATALAEAAPLDTTIATTRVQDDAALLGAQEAGRASVQETLLANLSRPAS